MSYLLLPLGLAVAAGAAAGILRWRYCVVIVRGQSMEPTFRDGDRLLGRRCSARRLRAGQVVIFREPGLRGGAHRPVWLTGAGRDFWVIKRVAAIPGDPVPDSVRPATAGAIVVPRRAIIVLGDAPVSRDSRDWGFIPASYVLGVGVRPASARLGPGRSQGQPGRA